MTDKQPKTLCTKIDQCDKKKVCDGYGNIYRREKVIGECYDYKFTAYEQIRGNEHKTRIYHNDQWGREDY